jgi:hypothetical protein
MRPMVILALLVLTCVACGTSREAQSIESAAGGEGSVTPANPVSVRDLLALLPAPAGWEREKPTGERPTTPVNFADVMVRLMKGDATVTAKITDTALNPVLVAPYASSLAGADDRKTSSGYEKAIRVGDSPAFEKWDAATKSGTVTVVVNKRFIVEIDGSSIDDPKVLHEILEKIDLRKLADLNEKPARGS